MFDTEALKHTFGQAAAHYDAHAELQREVREHCIMLAKHYWSRGASVLDVGCGTGAVADESKSFGWNITGADVAPGMCALAAKHHAVINASAEALPFVDESVDGVFSSLMLQWMNDPSRALGEIARVLKPGAHAVLSTFAEGTLFELEQAFRAVDDAPHVSRFLAPHRFLELAEAAEFSLTFAQQVRVVEYYHDAVALMRRLQAIGATNKDKNRRRGLMTSRQFAALEKAYEPFRQPEGLPATWQVLYVVVEKA
jgi:malonyl-CoA O-methyltransferase